jgi:hypothetical protein
VCAGKDAGQPLGSPAPDFLVRDEDESVYSLADLLAPGEPVVLAFTDPECPGCRTIGPFLDRASGGSVPSSGDLPWTLLSSCAATPIRSPCSTSWTGS